MLEADGNNHLLVNEYLFKIRYHSSSLWNRFYHVSGVFHVSGYKFVFIEKIKMFVQWVQLSQTCKEALWKAYKYLIFVFEVYYEK